MGQINYPLLNKTPTFIFWDSFWHSKYSYKSFLYNDFFTKKILIFLFSSKYTHFFFKPTFYNFSKESLYLYQANKNTLLTKNKEINSTSTPVYFSKVWLLVYKNWLILNFYLFYPSGISTFKEKNSETSNIDLNLYQKPLGSYNFYENDYSDFYYNFFFCGLKFFC